MRRGRLAIAVTAQPARPGDLPIERLDRLRLVLNLKTAKAIGRTLPRSILARADELIE